MKHEFNFNDIGKREPYKVPDGFFAELETSINQRCTPIKSPRHWLRWGTILTGAASVAAVFAVLLSNGVPEVEKPTRVYTMSDVEQTFDRLCDADQAFIIDIYDQDVFLNSNDDYE